MYTRFLKKPKQSILLFGPRGTGKSTWIEKNFPQATTYDLLHGSEAIRLSKNPSLLSQELEALPPKSWVVLDEIQKVPSLLDEVHHLIEKKRLNFVLSGSSARKLKKGGANLLAGRALTTNLFPFVSAEVNFAITTPDVFSRGMLPLAVLGADPVSYLETYVETYLQEEIKAEALTRNIGGFARFLEIAARQNGQVTNVSNIARDAMVNRLTVQGYFEILVDTLIGFWLNPWKLKRATKQISHPKFYFFDPGIVRALSGRLPYPALPEEGGPLMETFLLNEIRAYISYEKLHYPLYFWSSHDQVEVDFFCETQKGFVAIEVKSASVWDKKFNKGLRRLRDETGKNKVQCIGVYLGKRPLLLDGIKVFPLIDFLKRLWEGKII